MKYLPRCLLRIVFSFTVVSTSQAIELPPLIHDRVHHGELANGLRYLILTNQQPADKVEIQLLVNVGSLSELDNERGLAHLLEHMAFRRTKNFGQGQVKAFIESEGMRLGHDTNAFTSHETTIYKLSVSKANADKAVQLIADWAGGGIEIDAAELAAEKNVVLDEARLRSSASDFYAELMAKMYPDSQYPHRQAIGSTKVVDQVRAAQLEAFYQREYQAQRMTVMIAGDIDAVATEAKVKSLFAAVKAGSAPRDYAVPKSDQGLRLFSHRNVEWLAQPVVRWTWLLPVESMGDTQAVSRDYRYQILAQLIQQRLAIQAQKPDSALMQTYGVYSHNGMFVPARQTELSFEAIVKENKLKDALREIYRELERAKRTGFSEQEISKAVAALDANANYQLSNAQWAERMLLHVRYGQSLRTADTLGYLRGRLRTLSKPQDYQQLLQELLKNPNQLAYMLLPKQLNSFALLTEQSVKSMVQDVQAEKLDEVASVNVKPLMATLPTEGKIIKREPDLATGGQLLTLSNGIEVLTIPNEQSRVGFAAVAKSGMLALDKKLWPAGRVANQYFTQVGFGDLNFTELTQALTEKPASLYPVIDIDQFAWMGDAPRNQLETLLQLQYLAFTSRRQDDAIRKASSQLAHQHAKANANSIIDLLNSRRYGENWPATEFWRKENYETSVKQLNEVREQWLANPAEFRFVLTGVNNDSEFHEQLIARYIASLPTQAVKPRQLPKLSVITPASITEPRLDELKGAVRILQVSLKVPPSTESAVLTEALSELVRMRLHQALRETAGETYGVQAWSTFTEAQGVLINIQFRNDQRQCTETAKIVEKELARINQEPVSEVELGAVRDRITKMIKELPQNPMMHAKMMANQWILNQKPLTKIPDLAEYSPEMLHLYSQSWLSAGNWTSGVFNCSNEIDFAKLKAPIETQQVSK